MEIIILKAIFCSAVVLGFYHLVLSKEKMFAFNRFYLIFGLLFSLVIPFVNINLSFMNEVGNLNTLQGELDALQITSNQNVANTFNWRVILWIIYGIGVLFLLTKLIVGVVQINKIKGEKITKEGIKIIVSNEVKSPFSFWKTMYLNSTHLIDNEPKSVIFIHEKNHIKEFHALDIFFVEVVKALFWFNPLITFYKKAIQTNHEFLADESVLKEKQNISTYQHIILNEIENIQNNHLIHTFNYTNTKKRFIMMSTKKSKFATLKKGIAIGIFALFTIGFSQNTYAQETTKEKKTTYEKDITPPVFPGGDKALMNKIMEEFNIEAIEEEKSVQTTISYIDIDKKGNLLKIRTEGKNKKLNTEVKRCLSKILKGVQWTPAKRNGKAVNYAVKIPISMAPPQGLDSKDDVKHKNVRREIQKKIKEIKKNKN